MNDSDLELLLYRIINKYFIFYYNEEEYTLYQSDGEIKYRAQLIYEQIINDEKYDAWPREKDVENNLLRLGIWNMQSKSQIEFMEKQIENDKVDLYKNYRVSAYRKKFQNSISAKRKGIDQLIGPKNDFYTNTLEFYASNIKNQYIICRTLKKNNKQIFKDNDTDSILFNSMLSKINTYSISIEDFKYLARSQFWRSYWNANKNNVFSGSVDSWSDDQRVLVNISKMYDSIYEHPECPEDDIIEDSDALDGWMIMQKQENKKQKQQKSLDQKLNPKMKNAQSIYLPASDEQSRQDIMNLNSFESKSLIEQDRQALRKAAAEGRSLKDAELPSSQHRYIQQHQAKIQSNKGK
jgi:hypothetical protein